MTAPSAAALCFLLLQPDPAALIPLYQQALAERERELGPQHPKLARLASDFGLFHRKNGNPDAARPLLRRALDIDARHYGSTNRITAEDMENLASVSSPGEAIALRRRAALCDDAGVAARNLAAIGAWEQAHGSRERALTFYQQALAKEQAASGDAHPRFAVRLNDLALLLHPAQAEPLLHRALAIQESALGPSHPEVAVTLNNLANVLLATGQSAEAERAARRSLTILEQGLGASHPRVATAASNLADILQARQDLTAARLLYERALRIDEKAYGASHPEVAVDLENLAALLDRLGRKQEAAQHRARAARIKASAR